MNPAAEHCVAQGGLYGIVDDAEGKRGVCVLESGERVDAWTYFRAAHSSASDAQIANPAATACKSIGGTYVLDSSMCRLPDGSETDAWSLLRKLHQASASLTNPAATACVEAGGAYEIRDGENGKVGICRLPDGTEADAWTLFRETD